MKKLALQVAAISLALAGTASAADLRRPAPVKAPAPAPVLAYSWTGCYVGGGGGYGMWNQESSRFSGAPAAAVGLSWDNGGRGWFGTVQVGCDYQVAPSIVIGVFGDYDWSGIKGDMSHTAFGWVGEEKLKNSWAVGGRIGWVPWTTTNFMVFLSGGYTQAKFSGVTFRNQFNGALTGWTLPGNTYDGWFIGTGYEYGMALLPGLFWKTEYRFADYGEERLQLSFNGVLSPTEFLESRKFVHTVRSELVWRFNFGGWGAPVAARY